MKSESYGDNRNVFHELIGRALVDDEYRRRLVAGSDDDRSQLLKELGIDPTPAHISALSQAVEAIRHLADHISPDIKAAT